jgi:hypothetical protein
MNYLDGCWKAAVLTSAGTTWSAAGIELALGTALLAAMARRGDQARAVADRAGARSRSTPERP